MADIVSTYRYSTVVNLDPGWTNPDNAEEADGVYASCGVTGGVGNYYWYMKGTDLSVLSGIALSSVKQISKVEVGMINYQSLEGIDAKSIYLIPLLNGTTALSAVGWSIINATTRALTTDWYDITAGKATWLKDDVLNLDLTAQAASTGSDSKFTANCAFFIDVLMVRVTWTRKPAGLLFAHNF